MRRYYKPYYILDITFFLDLELNIGILWTHTQALKWHYKT
jgi:hypothetical protein